MDRLRAAIDTYRSWLDLRVDDVLRGRMRRVPGDLGLAEELREVFKSNLLIIDIYDRDFIDREWTLDELIKKLREYLSHLEKEAYPTKDVLL
jgi:cobalamin biosynthesis Mg chelatase CobN